MERLQLVEVESALVHSDGDTAAPLLLAQATAILEREWGTGALAGRVQAWRRRFAAGRMLTCAVSALRHQLAHGWCGFILQTMPSTLYAGRDPATRVYLMRL